MPALAAARATLECGVTLLDTSPLCGAGLVEHRCGSGASGSWSRPRSAGWRIRTGRAARPTVRATRVTPAIKV